MKQIFVIACMALACSAVQGVTPRFKELHRFGKTSGDGSDPTNVVVGKRSVLYGVTQEGGANGFGTAFSLTPPSSPSGTWKEAILYTFAGSSDGESPGSVVEGASGVLYGVTYLGGSSGESPNCDDLPGCGTVFSLTPPSLPGGAWTEAVLYRFQGGATDRYFPVGELAIGSGGVLYGVTDNGGNSTACGGYGCGTVFSLTPPASPGGSWTEAVLYSFGPANGTLPGPNGVVIGSDGTLYSAVNAGGETGGECGEFGCGTVLSFTPPSSPGGAWTPAILYTFTGGADGSAPGGPVVVGPGGVLYGPLIAGGSGAGGAVFTLTPPASPGGPWTEAVLFNFGSYTSGGTSPRNIILDAKGTIYGTTEYGGVAFCKGVGANGCGVVFSLAPPASPGGAWTEDVLYTFGSADGIAPGPLVLKNGVLYGVDGYRTGMVFSLKPV